MIPAERLTPTAVEAFEAEIGRECVATHRRLYPKTGSTLTEVGGGVALYTGRLPTTRVLSLGMGGPVSDRAFERIEAFYRQHGVPVAIDLCPYAHPSVAERLAARGYRPCGWKQILVRALDASDGKQPPTAGIAVRRVDENLLATWSEVLGRGFLEGAALDGVVREMNATLFAMPSNACWIADADGVPAGGGCLAERDGVASLSSGSTLPEFRGRGVHTALIRARLAHAAAGGCRRMRVSASPGSPSQRNLERHGFVPVYSRLTFQLDPATGPGALRAHRV